MGHVAWFGSAIFRKTTHKSRVQHMNSCGKALVITSQILQKWSELPPPFLPLVPSIPIASHTIEHHPLSDTSPSSNPVHSSIPLLNRCGRVAWLDAAESPSRPHSLPSNHDTATDRPFVLQKGIIYRSAITTRSFRRSTNTTNPHYS